MQSEHSPGLVQDEEDIIYCLIDPDLIDRESNGLTKKAFSKSVLRKTELSVVRKPFSSCDEVQEKVVDPQIAKIPGRRFCGVFVCQSSEIRAIGVIAAQDICVADAGLNGFSSHAHLGFCHEVASKGKSVQEAARSNLVTAFENRGIQDLKAIFQK